MTVSFTRLRPPVRKSKDKTSKWRQFIRLLAYANQPLHRSWWCGTFIDGLPKKYSWAFTESAYGYYTLTPAGWSFYYDYLCDENHEYGDLDIYNWIMKKSCLPFLFRGFHYRNPLDYDNLLMMRLMNDYPKIFNKKLLAKEMNIRTFTQFIKKLQRHIAKVAFDRTLRGQWNYNFAYNAILTKMGILRKNRHAKSKFEAYVSAA